MDTSSFKIFHNKILQLALTILVLMLSMETVRAGQTPSGPNLSKGQTLYVPAYSHIYIGHKASPYMLTITLSIRNIDPESSLRLTSVDYYGTDGNLIRKHLTEPVTVPPMATTRYVVKEPDKTGGSGANFIVKWTSMKKMNAPIVESIMIGTRSQQGISFTSRGQEIIR